MRPQTTLHSEIEQRNAPLMAAGELVLGYEMAEVLTLPEAIDRDFHSTKQWQGIQALPLCYASHADALQRRKLMSSPISQPLSFCASFFEAPRNMAWLLSYHRPKSLSDHPVFQSRMCQGIA